MKKVKDVMQSKGGTVATIGSSATVYNALMLMVENDVGALLVLDINHKLVGLITERDYSRKVVLKGKSSKETLVKEIMSEHPATVSLEDKIENCRKIMTEQSIHYLPIVDGDKLMGLISAGDILRHLNNEQGEIIKSLENYINH